MGYGGWQQRPGRGQPQVPGQGPWVPGPPPPPGQRFDPLAAGAAVPSWPDEAPIVTGGPPRLALSTDDGMAGAWPELPGLPPIGPAGEEPSTGPRILIPVAAALTVLAGLLLVPWQVRGGSLVTVAGAVSDRGPRDVGELYALYLAGPVGLLGVLVAFAGATDLRPVRWLQLGAAVLVLGGVAVSGLDVPAALQPYLLGAVGSGILAAIVVACLKRLPLRVVAGGYLVGCALLHLGVLATWQAPWLSGLAYLPALGYLVGAAGAVIGPRYVPAYRPL